jgi:cell division inhibitor SepF
MASGIVRKAMVFLGLDDEEAEDYEVYDEAAVAPQPPRRYQPEPVHAVPDDRPPLTGIRPMAREQTSDPGGSVRVAAAPATVRPITAVTDVRVLVVTPTRFADAQEIGEQCKQRTPVVVNLKEADGPLSRRMIDFCSGVTYALSGAMERVAEHVFLLTPENVEVPPEELRKLQESGFTSS